MNKFRVLFPVLFLLAIGFSSCQTGRDISKENFPSACNDKLYLELQKRDSSTYTQFEKNYFRKMQAECINGVNTKEHAEKQEAGEKVVLGIAIAGGIAVAIIVGFLLVGYKQ